MSGLFHELTRRGVQHIHQSGTLKLSMNDPAFAETYKMPTWGIVMLASTAAVFFLIMSTIEYTFGRLIPTLLMVETPQALLLEPLQSLEPDAPLDSKTDSKALHTDSELLFVKQKLITSSFRTTIKHLRAKAGVWSRFRGLAIFLVHASLMSTLTKALNVPLIPFGLAPIVSAVILANIRLAWTHIVISAPSTKRWYQRLPTARTWKKVALPTAVLAIAEQVTVLLPAGLAMIIGIDPTDADKLSNAERQVMMVKGLAVVGVAIGLAFLLVVPANVILTRVQASLLNDEEETIVPFDRSFGGKVVPEIVGGSGAIGMLEAWKTFNWNARIRLIKAYAKVMGMQIGLSVLFFVVMVGQILLIVGKSDLKKLLPVDGGKGN